MKRLLPLITLSLYLVLSTVSRADETDLININNCADDLNNLQLLSTDAAEQSLSAIRVFDKMEYCQHHVDEQEHSMQACDTLKSDYQMEIIELRDDLRTLENRLRTLQRSCGFDFVLSNRGKSLR